MTARRIVHIDTLDADLVSVRCPDWCNGEFHQVGGYRTDITHTSDDTELTVDTDRGPVLLLGLSLESRPFTERPPGTGVFVNVEIGGDNYPHDVAGLERLADQIAALPDRIREQARQLAALQAEEGEL
ncbi:DUF6907 domain-containing protein [Actinacidiphila oryziradicis]|uniref:Uncharacterized protein n=1 Tax=Actinacidiphila oryziradicis TaxID=2571141 RepID=A0A4U0SSY8_9ACTN|nr:hypothetical protein [Actinacidiphila oryziradicis]TKA13172.1 hypothetical protein FCI23_00040 [Actinacidiphila oryziradicis]